MHSQSAEIIKFCSENYNVCTLVQQQLTQNGREVLLYSLLLLLDLVLQKRRIPRAQGSLGFLPDQSGVLVRFQANQRSESWREPLLTHVSISGIFPKVIQGSARRESIANTQRCKLLHSQSAENQSVLNAVFHPRGEVTNSKRHRVRGSSSEREDEQTCKRPAAQQSASPSLSA